MKIGGLVLVGTLKSRRLQVLKRASACRRTKGQVFTGAQKGKCSQAHKRTSVCRRTEGQVFAGAQKDKCLQAHKRASACRHKKGQVFAGAQKGKCLPAHKRASVCRRTKKQVLAGAQKGKCLQAHKRASTCRRSKGQVFTGAQKGKCLQAHKRAKFLLAHASCWPKLTDLAVGKAQGQPQYQCVYTWVTAITEGNGWGGKQAQGAGRKVLPACLGWALLDALCSGGQCVRVRMIHTLRWTVYAYDTRRWTVCVRIIYTHRVGVTQQTGVPLKRQHTSRGTHTSHTRSSPLRARP